MAKHFNRLTPAEAERLAILLEEMGEVQQAIGKILRHGYESQNPDDCESDSNRQNLQKELGDVMYAIGALAASGDISGKTAETRVVEKTQKIRPYLHHQSEPVERGESR